MNLEEYKRRVENMHSVTGVPTYWEELQAAVEERDKLQKLVEDLRAAGDVLAREVEIGGRCACRREWTCHKCEAVEAWRSVRGR